jgi:hypothetical protein
MTVIWHHEHHRHERHVAKGRGDVVRLLGLSIFFLAGLFCGAWFYWSGWRSDPFPVWLERVAYVPIGVADQHVLWYASIARLAHGIAAADNRTTVSEADYGQAIDAIVRNNALDDLAHDVSVSVSSDAIQKTVTWTEDLDSFNKMAGWSDGEYITYIDRGLALSRAVEDAIHNNDAYESSSRDRMTAIQAKLGLGIAFEDVAKEYSEDPVTAPAKGSFGYVLPVEVDAGFAPVFALPVHTLSDVVSLPDAYWIVRTEDAVTDESGTRYLLRGIAVRKATLSEVLDEKTKDIYHARRRSPPDHPST